MYVSEYMCGDRGIELRVYSLLRIRFKLTQNISRKAMANYRELFFVMTT